VTSGEHLVIGVPTGDTYSVLCQSSNEIRGSTQLSSAQIAHFRSPPFRSVPLAPLSSPPLNSAKLRYILSPAPFSSAASGHQYACAIVQWRQNPILHWCLHGAGKFVATGVVQQNTKMPSAKRLNVYRHHQGGDVEDVEVTDWRPRVNHDIVDRLCKRRLKLLLLPTCWAPHDFHNSKHFTEVWLEWCRRINAVKWHIAQSARWDWWYFLSTERAPGLIPVVRHEVNMP